MFFHHQFRRKLHHLRGRYRVPGTSDDYRDVYEALSGNSLRRCPSCDDGRLLVIKVLPRPNNRQWFCDTS
jgi:hypothetical protein